MRKRELNYCTYSHDLCLMFLILSHNTLGWRPGITNRYTVEIDAILKEIDEDVERIRTEKLIPIHMKICYLFFYHKPENSKAALNITKKTYATNRTKPAKRQRRKEAK